MTVRSTSSDICGRGFLPLVRPAASANETLVMGMIGSPRRTRCEVLARGGSGRRRDVLRRARDDDLAAARAALRAEIDDPVGRLDHVEVVLDHDHRVAVIDEPMEHLEQLLHVREMQPGRWLVEQVDASCPWLVAIAPWPA